MTFLMHRKNIHEEFKLIQFIDIYSNKDIKRKRNIIKTSYKTREVKRGDY